MGQAEARGRCRQRGVGEVSSSAIARSEATKQSSFLRRHGLLTWGSGVSRQDAPLCSTAATSPSRPRELSDGARRSSQGRPEGALRSGLALTRSSTPSGCCGRGGSGPELLSFAIQGSSRFTDLVCMPDQTHIRSSHEATAPTFRLRRAGSRGRGHSSLRLFKAMQSIGSSTRIGRG